ncbi:unnamed protein product, partial [Adineta ricciae]
ERSIQTSAINLRESPQKPSFIPIKEVELSLDQRRTLSEDNPKNPRKDLLSNKQYREYIDGQCNNVQSISELVKKIESYSSNDFIRTWLTFYWIAKNIKYVNGHVDNAADVVFRTKRGVCRGFTYLFSECCRLLNIECVDVPGYVKENWFRIGDALQQATHVWNAVKLGGHWYLLDATWGAGSPNANKLEEFYFLTSPDQLIYT